jgi:hypothetical protein
MRNLTMANGCLDARCHWMKRLESCFVIIGAEHVASVLQDAFAWYQFFPISKISSPHLAQFRSVRLFDLCRNRNPDDLGMSAAPGAAGSRLLVRSRF